MTGRLVAIVPARGGSKRIPRKNIRPFVGVPLLARTLRTLLECELFERVVVSTDDDEIAAVAVSSGAEVPFRRPVELADDHTTTAAVVVDAVGRLESKMNFVLDPLCVVYPAAVFARPTDLIESYSMFVETGADLVLSAGKFSSPIGRAWRRLDDGTSERIWPETRDSRSQDLEQTFYDAGQFYWARRSYWFEHDREYAARIAMFEMPRWRIQDIDTPDDWIFAELLYEVLKQRPVVEH